MFFTSILALTDFSVDGDKAVERAAQMAATHAATLCLMPMPAAGPAGGLDPQTRLRQSAHALAMRLGITVNTAVAADGVRSVATQAKTADLLVIPQRSKRFVRDWLLGPQAIRLLRHCRCPVLVARGAVRRRLRHIVVGVEFTPAAHHRATLACLLDPDAEVELFHAVDMEGEQALRQADVDGEVIRNYRDNCAEHARMRLGWMTQALRAQGHAVETAARRGTPAQQLVERQQWLGADLLVVGKQRRHGLVDHVLRSTAHEVLARAGGDVLLVPHDYELSAARVPCPATAQRGLPDSPAPA